MQHVVVLVAVIYYSGRIQTKSAKEKVHGVRSGGARQKLPEPSPGRVTQDAFNASSNES